MGDRQQALHYTASNQRMDGHIMPARSKGPRLKLRAKRGRTPTWYICDGPRELSTHCAEPNRVDAEKALAEYIGQKHEPDFGKGSPAQALIFDVLIYYSKEKAPSHAHPEIVSYHLQPLGKFFDGMTCDKINGDLIRQYTRDRMAGKLGRIVKQGTVRRELGTLQAALNFAVTEGKLKFAPTFVLPAGAPPRERHLTRGEVARLLAGALGFTPGYYEIDTRLPLPLPFTKREYWVRLHKPLHHVARFILIALYTGTRHEAILRLRWGLNSDGGWFDLAHRKLYRKGDGQRETNKRRTPAPIHDRLMPHLVRWRDLTINGPVEYNGKLIDREKRGFNVARSRACLDADVTPHVLRHTCATMLLRDEVPVWEVAGYLGTSAKVIESTYGHHSPQYMQAAARSNFGRKPGTMPGTAQKMETRNAG